MDDTSYAVTERHLHGFGFIIHAFARHEFLLSAVIAAIMRASLDHVVFATSGLGYAAKLDAFKNLLVHSGLPADQIDRLRSFAGETDKHNRLRNDVAHSTWCAGRRRNSIKPMRAITHGGKGKFVGNDPDERDYTAEDLITLGQELNANYNRFVTYLEETGLLGRIEQQIDAT